MSDIDVSPVEEVEDDDVADENAADDGSSDIDVDVVDDAGGEPETRTTEDVSLDGVDAPEYVLYGGKGGVGKTTMAAATALASASDGTRTLVVSTDPAHSLSDTLGVDVPAKPGRVREDVPLWGAEIDPEVAAEEGVDALGVTGNGEGFGDDDPFADAAGGPGSGDQSGGLGGGGQSGGGGSGPFGGANGGAGPMGGLGEMLGGDDPLGSMMGGAVPGADEAAAIQLLMEYIDDPRFDRVVVDTAPTGHTLRLLELPEVMDSMVGRMMSIKERLSGLMDGMMGMFGDDDAQDAGGVDDLRELADRIEELRDVLQDPARTDFRVVMIPEEMSVLESERLIRQLDDYSIPNGTVVVNKVMEDLADVTDAVDATDFVTPDLEDCEFCQQRWSVQQDALARAQDVFRGHDVKRVPLFADEVAGDRMLRVVAHCLE
ncbi:TRC40/GET3/ArsA family transport-energizing ATPase [Halorubellus sp. JP-L1]|uniref:ArsA family ATPase n=1 Tax=Halorubellus sp. JP-L1 TaxID=2715753 RepID=UPI00140BC40D|nr:TRC40/GET3/ArsA family transport-energizing ATPase [Halorubellus sp. JP-L1]NHN42408.1 TRC40/GET3/ArsA family transport-energizing ATPase [Halorubellus sp. JP-L1]